LLRDGEFCAACPVGHRIIAVNGAIVQVLWYLFVPECSHLAKYDITANIRLSTEANCMRRTFPEEMVHIEKLIKGNRGILPTLIWFDRAAELAIAQESEHSMKMVALQEIDGMLEELEELDELEFEETIIG
jgi:hypothetical protein